MEPATRHRTPACSQAGDGTRTYGLLSPDGASQSLIGELAQAGVRSLQFSSLRSTDSSTMANVAKAVQNVANLVSEGAVYIPPAATFLDKLGTMVLDQRVAVWPEGLVASGPSAKLPFAVGTIPYPNLTNRFDGYIGYTMSIGTQHPDLAWRWLKFLSQNPVPRKSRD